MKIVPFSSLINAAPPNVEASNRRHKDGRMPLVVCVLQPAIPPYRDAFYTALQSAGSNIPLRLRVFGSVVDFNGVRSITTSTIAYESSLVLESRVFGTGRWRLVWYKNWPLEYRFSDVVVINGNPRILNNYIALMRCKVRGVPIIWWGQGWSAGSRGLLSVARRLLMRAFDLWILYTDKEKDDYIKLGFNPSRITALNNGVDVAAIRKAVIAWPRERLRDFQVKNHLTCRTWIVFLGRLRAASGVELLMPALSNVPSHIGLIILGAGGGDHSIRQQMQELGLDERVRWPGAIFEEDLLAPWLLSSSLLVYPGNIGLSLIHAFAYSLPAVVHDETFAHGPEIAALQPGINGWEFSREQGSFSLAAAITRALADETLLLLARKHASDTVQANYTVEAMAERFLSILPRRLGRAGVS